MTSFIKLETFDENHVSYSFKLEKSFTLPSILASGTVNEVQEFLGFFDGFFSREKDAFNKKQLKDVTMGLEESIRTEVQEQFDRQIHQLRRELDIAERRLKESGGEAAALRGQLEGLMASMGAAGRIQEEEIRSRIDESWKERIAELKEEHNTWKRFFEERLQESQAELKAAQEKLFTRDSALKTSARRGRAGEDAFAEAASSAVGWNLERIADQARACDFKMDYNGTLVRFEIKNHEHSVPGEDIKKFRRDLEEHRDDTGIGVFVALNAHLGGFMKGRIIHQEWKDDSGQLLIYISAFNELDADFVFLLLKQVFDAFIKYKSLRDGSDEDSVGGVDGLRSRIDSAMIHAQGMIRHIKELTLKCGRDKKTVMKMYDDSLEMLKSISSEYNLMIGSLLGTNTEAIADTPVIDTSSVPTATASLDAEIDNSSLVIVEAAAAPVAAPAPTKRKRLNKKDSAAAI